MRSNLAVARQPARAQVPAGTSILSETILSDGRASAAKGVADSASAALEKARPEVLEGAEVTSEKELLAAARRSIEVEAFDEQAASLSVKRTIDSSSACSERYCKAKLGAILFSPNRFIINASGQDISGMMASGREMAARATAHCWSCRATVRMVEDRCGSCGQEQDIKL